MNQSLKDSKVLIVGTSSSVAQYDKKFLQEKRENGYKILSYSGNSLIYLYDIGFKPDFFIFFDPFAYTIGIGNMGERCKDWLKETTYIGYENSSFESLLATNKFLNGSESFGFTDFLRNDSLVNLYKDNPPSEIFKECLCENPTTVNFDQIENLNLSDRLYMIRNYGNELDKFTYYLLPVIFNFFKNLSTLKCLGFGTFGFDRYRGTSGSYSEYVRAYDQILPHLNNVKINQNVDIKLEDDSYFKKVETLFSKDIS